MQNSSNFKIPVPRNWIEQIVRNAAKDKENKNCLRLQGEFSKPFAKAIEEHENLKIEFRSTHGVVWTKPSRASTPHLRING
jgi:hypothetical protein